MIMDKRNSIDALIDAQMLNLVLASMVSAESLTDAESCRLALDKFLELKADLPSSSIAGDPEWMKRFEDAERIIRHDLECYLKDDGGE